MNVWQISPPAAVANSVAEFYLGRGVALLSPGDQRPWSPEHRQRVRCCLLPEEYDFGDSVFAQGRLSRVQPESVQRYVTSLPNSPPTHLQMVPLPELRPEDPLLEEVPPALQSLVATANDLVPLFSDGQVFGEPSSEDELVNHFVVPFLRAMGGTPERMAIKRRSVDVPLFRALRSAPETCRVVIEARRLGAGVEQALD